MQFSAPRKKGQIALEFLIMTGAVLAMFVMVIIFYSNNIQVGNEIENRLSATQLCLHISSILSSFSSVGDDSAYVLELPPHLNYRNYTVWILSEERMVVVDYETVYGREAGATCRLYTSGIRNSNGSTFFSLGNNSNITNEGGAILVEP